MDLHTSSLQAPESSEGLKFLLGQSHGELFALIEELTVDGGQTKLGIKEQAQAVRHERSLSGFRYLADGWIQGHILLGFLPEGGFVLHTSLAQDGLVTERCDFYNEAGILTHSAPGPLPSVLLTEGLEMDLDCPLLDQLFNFLVIEYGRAKVGSVRSGQVYQVERFLRTRRTKKGLKGSIEQRRDPLIRHVFHKMLIIEADPVLNWEERQTVYDNLLAGLSRVLKAKQRALGIGPLTQGALMWRFRWASFVRRFRMRPTNNLLGLLYRYTIQKMVWFYQTVRSNLGLSVAMAVYGPFTYYFITMPMNPHAMQAVGKVRSAYLDTKNDFMGKIDQLIHPVSAAPENLQVQAQGPLTLPTKDPTAVGGSAISTGAVTVPLLLDGKTVEARPAHLNLLLTTDVAAIDQVNWSERMGNFKQMQIAYEEGLEFAPRLGRLEQLETQYNFPMVVESAWEEMERYDNSIFRLRKLHPDLSPRLQQYLTNEVNRTQQLELYLWDRLARFILDQPYVMLDDDQEQKRSDYYVGRAFVFMGEMSQIMKWRYPDFKLPYGHERIEKLAKKYRDNRQEKGDILANLRANSDLFKQKDAYSTKEFRSYMKRQWEILYLQNSKVEEASNNGLNMYIWSVRNTAWCLQSIYSAKRQELELLVERDTQGHLAPESVTETTKLELLYETLFHNLTLEWVGVKEEIGSKLGKDIETIQRRVVVENLKEFLGDRAKLVNQPKTTAEISAEIKE